MPERRESNILLFGVASVYHPIGMHVQSYVRAFQKRYSLS